MRLQAMNKFSTLVLIFLFVSSLALAGEVKSFKGKLVNISKDKQAKYVLETEGGQISFARNLYVKIKHDIGQYVLITAEYDATKKSFSMIKALRIIKEDKKTKKY